MQIEEPDEMMQGIEVCLVLLEFKKDSYFSGSAKFDELMSHMIEQFLQIQYYNLEELVN